jgi:D-arabinose 1-dehydrogenase-like Zn-dependent alcohol dehydrogenase
MKKVGKLGDGDEVVVLGCGGVGMMGIQFAKSLFGKAPLAADIDDGRLDAALKGGAKAAYNSKDPAAAKKLVADTGGAFAVVDFVGSEASFAFANAVVRRGGRIIIVGLFGGAMTMPLPLFPMRALSIIGSFVGSLPEAQEMMAIVRAGKVDPIPFATRPLAQAGQTLSDLRAGKITGRVVLTP